jgi:chorismate synthase
MGGIPRESRIGVVIDGCPPRLDLSAEEIQKELDRRRPGPGSHGDQSARVERDRVEILSGNL